MDMLTKLYDWYGKMTVRLVMAVIAVLVIGVVSIALSSSGKTEAPAVDIPTVRTAAAGSLGSEATIQLVGTVKSVSQAEIETESAGRVTAVSVELGDSVVAGQIIAQLENDSERAAVLQAEGAYEAALASAAQSDVGVAEAGTTLANAQNNAISVYRDAYTTFRTILVNNVDDIFSNPDNATPGVLVNTPGNTAFLNSERVRFQTVLSEWQSNVTAIDAADDLSARLVEAAEHVRALREVVSILLISVNDSDSVGSLTQGELATLATTFAADQQTLNALLTTIASAENRLDSAAEALTRAQIGGTNNDVSAANAQVKQALGALRSAQANLAKTVLRTPIAGTVNTLNIDLGDFVGSFETIAVVANNNALEVTTFVGESDRQALEIGQPVLIERTIPGTITNIAPAIDPVTRKVEIKIATENDTLANGNTVSIQIQNTSETATDTALFVPITAVKFTETAGQIFTVENGVLTGNPVETGRIQGSFVEIISGITAETEIVVDGRGKAVGQMVEAISK